MYWRKFGAVWLRFSRKAAPIAKLRLALPPGAEGHFDRGRRLRREIRPRMSGVRCRLLIRCRAAYEPCGDGPGDSSASRRWSSSMGRPMTLVRLPSIRSTRVSPVSWIPPALAPARGENSFDPLTASMFRWDGRRSGVSPSDLCDPRLFPGGRVPSPVMQIPLHQDHSRIFSQMRLGYARPLVGFHSSWSNASSISRGVQISGHGYPFDAHTERITGLATGLSI